MSNNKNILVLTYWSFNDALIQTYTLPYVKQIADAISSDSKVFLVTLEKDKKPDFPFINKIHFVQFSYNELGLKAAFAWIRTIFTLLRLIRKEKINTIHAWCTPAGMIGYILAVLSGKELVIDSFEPHAEAMVENGVWKKNSFAFKLLFKFEKLQAHKAKHLISIASKMGDYSKEKYSLNRNDYYVKPACVNLDLFSISNRKKPELIKELHLENKIVCVYAGKFGGIYLEKEAFDFFKTAHQFWGNRFVVLLLTANSKEEIDNYCDRSGLDKSIVIRKFIPHSQIPDYIGLGDFAITPVKPIPTKKYCSPIKDGEYWALGLPVVITNNISDDTDIIKQNNIGAVIESFDTPSYLNSIKKIDYLIANNTTEVLYTKIRPFAEKHRNFELAKAIYNKIYS